MGVGWRRFTERARQDLHLDFDPGFVPTPNARNAAMLREAADFAASLKRCEKDIRGVKTAAEALFTTTASVLTSQLPRVFEDTGAGRAAPAPPAPGGAGTVGGDFAPDDLDGVAKDASKKLEAEVLAPMARWATAYATVAARMKRLEGVRLEVDSRRRTVVGLGTAIDRQRLRLPHTRSKGEWQMEQTIKRLQHKEAKLAAARQAFKEQEALVFQQLAQLIRDAVWLKSYLGAVMRLQADAYAAAGAALGPSKAAAAAAGLGASAGGATAADAYGGAGIGAGRTADRTAAAGSPPVGGGGARLTGAGGKVGGYAAAATAGAAAAAAAAGKENGAAYFSAKRAGGGTVGTVGSGDGGAAARSPGGYDRYAADAAGAVW